MIITKTPLRICLGGGGTDLPSYYKQFGSFFISAAIDKYVYISLHNTFEDRILLKYSKLEDVERVGQIENSIIRETFKMHDVNHNIEFSSMADIPSGTGLGSSGSFTVGLLKAIYAMKKNSISQQELSEEACKIEMDILKRPIGKQDQYIASFGGITSFSIDKSGNVTVVPLRIPKDTLYKLEDNLLLFFTGFSRNAGDILKEQDVKSKDNDKIMFENLHFVKELGIKSKEALERGDLDEFAHLMNIHWEHKKQRSGKMSNPKIDEWYDLAMKNGAIGGKLIGAGGGGFLMFYTKDRERLVSALEKEGLKEVRFRFDFEGSRTLIND